LVCPTRLRVTGRTNLHSPNSAWDVTAKKKEICGNPQHVIFGGQPGEVALPKVETLGFLPNQINKHWT
jgi:hypothetical protein